MAQLILNMKQKLNIDKAITNHIQDVTGVAKQIMDGNFNKMVTNGKEGAPWTDQTGNARNSIGYADESTKGLLQFWFYIGVHYGIWLELSNQGKYRIMQPTFEAGLVNMQKDLSLVGLDVRNR